nr:MULTISPECIES: NTP transferase domain-containing protein [unclassified Ornithinimicrobium]
MAGGGGTRLGGVDKSALEIGGRTLLDRVLEAAAAARHVVVVGSVAVPEHVLQTVEDPPDGGPVAGIAAGVAALARTADLAPWTLVIAVDQPEAAQATVDLLRAAASAGPDVDMVCPQDETGHPQWLLAAYRTGSLTAALLPFGTGHSIAVRRLVAGLRAIGVHTSHAGDIDTWQDHTDWQARVTSAEHSRATATHPDAI